jgi:tetratricopeptide (TPR) repeat protein
MNELGKHYEEIKCYDAAININPLYAKALYSKGLIMAVQGNHRKLCCFDKVLLINPKIYRFYTDKVNLCPTWRL